MRRGCTGVVVILASLAALVVSALPAAAGGPSLSAFRGVAAWVDVFDYTPRLQQAGAQPRITPDSIDDMARLGVKTLYLQVANPDGAPARQLTDRAQLRALLQRAHQRSLAVVPWFLPELTNLADDLATMKQILGLRVGGERFDGIALDLESQVPDIAVRNRRTVDYARKVRALVGDTMPIAAIVYPAVQLEVLNTVLWPDFPYRGLARYVDVWMPMSYYTYRSTSSGLRNAYRYTVDSVARLRRHVGDAHAPVHLIGGLAEDSTPADYLDMARAARATGALGWSVYDYTTTGSWAWPYLRGQLPVPSTLVPPTTAPTTTAGSSTTTSPSTITTTTTISPETTAAP